jgi:GT2 family glycosyltransferase
MRGPGLMGTPSFSVVVPTYQRPRQLEVCLNALVRLDYPKDRYEIIIVNDGGTESLEPLASAFEHPPGITFLDQANSGPATARNEGVRSARGDYIAFTDDDCVPEPRWLRALAGAFQKWPSALIGGSTINQLADNTYSTASHSLIMALYAYYNRDPQRATFFTSNNIAMPRDLFWSIGGFDESFPMAAAEDRDLCDRWRDQSLPTVHAPDAIVGHSHELNLSGFLAQHFRYGCGAWHFQERRSARSQETPVEPLSFYRGLLAYPLSEPLGWRRLPVLSLVFLSQIANAAGFFREKMKAHSQ